MKNKFIQTHFQVYNYVFVLNCVPVFILPYNDVKLICCIRFCGQTGNRNNSI